MTAGKLEEEVAALLSARGLMISVAEACTAGLIASRLTTVPGSSRYFAGGVLAYANEVKERVLRVPGEVMVKEGSVSEATCLAMARGARRLIGTDLAVSATGVMGPGGGTLQKPVGIFFVAISGPGDTEVCIRHQFQGDREENRRQASGAALELIRRVLLGGEDPYR